MNRLILYCLVIWYISNRCNATNKSSRFSLLYILYGFFGFIICKTFEKSEGKNKFPRCLRLFRISSKMLLSNLPILYSFLFFYKSTGFVKVQSGAKFMRDIKKFKLQKQINEIHPKNICFEWWTKNWFILKTFEDDKI